MDLMSLTIDFSTIGGIAAFTVIVAQFLISICKVEKNWLKQLISWVIPVVVCVVGLLLQLGLFADYGTITDWFAWVYTIVTGFGIGLISNGIYDIPGVEKLMDCLKTIVENWRKKKENK